MRKFEFYKEDVLGVFVGYVVYKISAFVLVIASIFIVSMFNVPDSASIGETIGDVVTLLSFIAFCWVFAKIHQHYKKKKLLKSN